MNRLWPQNWGPRMEGALRAALFCLHEANSARAREQQYTLLDVLPMLTSADFREEVLKQVPDRALWVWWRDNYDRISRAFQQQTANPVTTKIGRFIVTETARLALGQSRSTIYPRALLREHRRPQIEERLTLGPAYRDRDLVFSTRSGTPIDPSGLPSAWGRIVRAANLPHLRFHDLRHIHATLMLLGGVHPKVVAERLGHADVRITLDTYSHVLPNLQAQAAAGIERLLAVGGDV